MIFEGSITITDIDGHKISFSCEKVLEFNYQEKDGKWFINGVFKK